MIILVKGHEVALPWPHKRRIEDDAGVSEDDTSTSIFVRFLKESMQGFDEFERNKKALHTAIAEVKKFVDPDLETPLSPRGQHANNVAAEDTKDQTATPNESAANEPAAEDMPYQTVTLESAAVEPAVL